MAAELSLKTLKDGLQNERDKMQQIVYNAIIDFESTTGCHVKSIGTDGRYDGRLGRTKTTFVSFNIEL